VASDPRPELSVVISTLGNHALLRRVLDGYERQTASPESFEVLVVADCAEPEPAAVEAAIGERAYPVRRLSGAVPGLSANRNVGWRAARAPVVLFTDNDTIPVPELVSEHLAWHRRWPEDEVAVVGIVRWATGLKVTPFMRWLEHGVQFDFHSIPGSQASWAHLYGANSSIKRRLLERVGGYDEERLPYGYEDLDWGYRAREHGLRVLLNRQAIVDHWRPMTVRDWQIRARRLAVSEWRFCQLHPDVSPWFQRKFADAAAQPAGGRRSATILRVVPETAPWIGPRLFARADLYWRQQIAPAFLAAWEQAAAGSPPELEPGAAALAERSG
jgi:GT2 family glycosyltransferase